MMRYFTAHNKNKCGITLMRVKDGIVVIAHVKVFNNQTIYTTPRCIGDCGCLNFCLISDTMLRTKSFNILKCIYNLCAQAMYNAQTKITVLGEQDGWVAGKGDWEENE